MSMRALNVLFLCSGNSARSIMAEVLLNSIGRGKFRAYSAGSHPKGEVHPLALELIDRNRLPTVGLRSKSWSEFARPEAPEMDFVFTVCDQAAGEVCPLWPGQPMTAHWGIDDPALVTGSDTERRRAFFKAFNELQNRVLIFVSLPLRKLDRHLLQRRLDEIGKLSAEDGSATNLADRIRAASRPTPGAAVTLPSRRRPDFRP
jgi:arsenate reductase